MSVKFSSDSECSSDEEDYQTEPDLERLAQLERILKSTFGIQNEDDIDDRPTKRLRIESEDEVEPVEAIALPPIERGEEIVAFRLFSTQLVPSNIVIRESEIWETVADPRIRDVDDEDEALVEARRLMIESIAIDGTTIISQSTLEPSSLPPHHSIELASVMPLGNPPSLAKISPAPIQEITTITLLSSRPSKSKQKRRPRQLPRQAHPSNPQSITYHRLIKSEIPLTRQELLELGHRIEKEIRQARIAATQRENDERGRLNRLEKLKRKAETQMELDSKPKEKKVGKKKTKKSALAKDRRAAKRLEEREQVKIL